MNDLQDFWNSTGFTSIDWQDGVLILIGVIFIYLAITKEWEPLELLPIGLGIVIANLPLTGMAQSPANSSGYQEAGLFGIVFHYGLAFWNILPPIIFIGIGALTDFTPIIANPKK